MSRSFDPDSVLLRPSHVIGGAAVADRPALALERPSDGKRHVESPIADADMVDRAVTSAAAALKASGWGSRPPRERTRAMQRWADVIAAEAEHLARLEAVSSTRLIGELVAGDIAVTAEQIRFFAELADKEGGLAAPTADDHLGLVIDEPIGVIGAITPWNFPLSMAGWKTGPALAAGNAVVLKPSELTPFATLRMAELAVEAGIPAGILSVVLGDGPTTGAAIVAHPGIGKVSFTGSTAAGSAILGTIARAGVKPVTLELGGKSPQIVFADADLDRAAACIAGSILFNAGQACVAGSRVLVARPVAEALAERLIARMSVVRPGPTWDTATSYSPLISARQHDRVDGLVEASRSAGAACLVGGAPLDREGFFYAPTILAPTRADDPAIREEIFGPVLTFEIFDDEAEAVSRADHPTYGLCAGIHTADLARALRTMRALATGTVWINRYGRSRDHILPTGGYKQSGIGKDLGREAYQACRRSKSVLIAF